MDADTTPGEEQEVSDEENVQALRMEDANRLPPVGNVTTRRCQLITSLKDIFTGNITKIKTLLDKEKEMEEKIEQRRKVVEEEIKRAFAKIQQKLESRKRLFLITTLILQNNRKIIFSFGARSCVV